MLVWLRLNLDALAKGGREDGVIPSLVVRVTIGAGWEGRLMVLAVKWAMPEHYSRSSWNVARNHPGKSR